jgi:large subunit ribosomal protein L25
MHAYKQLVLHVDFQRVDASQPIHTKVALHFVNAEVSPAVKLGGAIVSHVLNELDVSCLPGKLPEFITVDLSNLEAGQSVHVSDLTLPEGVTVIAHGKDQTVATSSIPRGAVAAETPAAE